MFWNRRVYADAAAATPLSGRATRELSRLLKVYGNPGGLHQEGIAAKKELERARKSIADSIGAHSDEIYFTASGTESNNLAIFGIEANGHAITSAIEHQSVLEPLYRRGLEVTEVAVDGEGMLIPNAIAATIRPDTTFVSVQLVNSEVGSVLPVRDIARELRRAKHKIYFHTDAAQAPLWMDLDVEKLGVDLMTLDAQKILGPKGIGALYIRRGTPMGPLILGGGQEHGLRSGTENVPHAGAFAVALADAKAGAGRRAKRVAKLRDYCWAQIQQQLPDAILNGPKAETRSPNNLNISIPGLDAEMAVISLDALGVAASTRSACSAGAEEPSHVIQALGVPPEMAGTAVRLTFLPTFSRGQARRIALALKETADRYRRT